MLKQLVILLCVCLVGVPNFQESEALGKEPTKKQRKKTWRGGGQMIPDVARDKVICFALYTVEKGNLKTECTVLSSAGRRSQRSKLANPSRWQMADRGNEPDR